MHNGVVTALCLLMLVGVAEATPSQRHLQAAVDGALRDLRVVDVRILTAADRQEHDTIVAMLKVARRATEELDGGAGTLAGQATMRAARFLRRVLSIDEEASLAEQYRTGGSSDALLDAAATRTAAELERLASLLGANRGDIRRPDSALAEFSPRLVAAGVLLHTSVAFRDRDAMGHLQYARDVLALLEDAWLPQGFRRCWYLAALGHVEGRLEVFDGMVLADEAVALFPSDPDVLVAAGVFDEALALPGLELPSIDSRAAWGAGSDATEGLPRTGAAQRTIAALWARKRSALKRAERLYRQALEHGASHAEAHLRLGRVLCLLGRGDEALAEFRVARGGGDQDLVYLASLFAGDVHERGGEWLQAIEEYTRARGACPSCLSANVALSQALRRSGDIDGASNTMESALGGGLPTRVDDPWRYYTAGTFLQRRRLVEEMRRSLQ